MISDEKSVVCHIPRARARTHPANRFRPHYLQRLARECFAKRAAQPPPTPDSHYLARYKTRRTNLIMRYGLRTGVALYLTRHVSRIRPQAGLLCSFAMYRLVSTILFFFLFRLYRIFVRFRFITWRVRARLKPINCGCKF